MLSSTRLLTRIFGRLRLKRLAGTAKGVIDIILSAWLYNTWCALMLMGGTGCGMVWAGLSRVWDLGPGKLIDVLCQRRD